MFAEGETCIIAADVLDQVRHNESRVKFRNLQIRRVEANDFEQFEKKTLSNG